ncbi:hypothetical protein [Sphingomonas prati]|uniref:Uncharacterized protein n=1 Tax=Sphingomonas prati TaxID=1843237 RepID=A0A7W9BUU9_9SPHN|nr:hypothetical protein [Sphingomonas prati]MBB5730329.1 hypothetical protein [Sphingomonas prati]GGE93271.1 hypothetical protein GCM10011404_27820 [Sphingomonas prati]
MTVDERDPPAMDANEFRYWSHRSAQEIARAINAQCLRSCDAHRRLALLCMRVALTYAPSAAICAPDRAEPE